MKTPLAPGKRRSVLSIAVVIVAGVSVSAFLWHRERVDARRDQQRLLAHLTQRVGDDVRARVERIDQTLQGLRGLYAVQGRIDRSAWENYLAHLEVKPMQGLSGFTYVRRVSPENHAAFFDELRSVYGAQLPQPPSAGDVDRAYVVLYRARASENALAGFDMSTHPVWFGLSDFTRRTGRTAFTDLVASIAPPHELALAVLAPLYETGRPTGSEAERVAALHGWIYACLDPSNFLSDLLPDIGRELQLEVYDVTDGASPKLVQRTAAAANDLSGADAIQESLSMPLLNRTWRLVLTAPSHYQNQDRSLLAGQLFAGGLLVSGLLAALIWNLGRTQHKATELAGAMTRELREKTWIFQHAQRIANIGVCYWDSVRRSVVRSEDYLRIFGLTESTSPSPGQEDVLKLVHSEDRARVAETFSRLPSGKGAGTTVFE